MVDTASRNCSNELLNISTPTFVDFFAGSGLDTQRPRHAWVPVWSNDICPKKPSVIASENIVGLLSANGGGIAECPAILNCISQLGHNLLIE